ncbi:capsule biosynthesis GfcC family protein [Aliiglaciecola litoralis]|uniref:Capsule biosynthesis GfcC n=1 Tax=Aliiglaciecola litoralis TaxID=582857 RepID=A0ABN1LHJ2_9ALTE
MISRLIKILLTINIMVLSMSSNAAVEVTLNETDYSFGVNPRLSDVLAPVAFEEDWYWPASRLFKRSSNASEAMRSQVIALLAENGISESKYKATYQSIINQIKNWQLADRITITIDYELARISAKHNPRVESGQYQLILSKRPSTLHVFGAVETPVEIIYQNNTCIEDVVSQMKLAEHADPSFVYLISPQGKVQKTPVAYWNKTCVLAMPGSMVYVPLQESAFFPSNNDVNQKVAELAVNRIAIP